MEILDKLPSMNFNDNETGCCPRFHPEDWDEKIFCLDNYTFAKARSKSLFHIPINLGKVMTETMGAISKSEADDKERYLILSHDNSPWSTDHYFLTTKEVDDLNMSRLKGNYITKVFEGPYNSIPKWIHEFEEFIESQGYTFNDFYAFYTTCPKCAKHYGANYVVLFASI